MHVWCIIASFLQCIKSDRMHQIGINASILMCGAKSPRWTPAGKRRSRDTERSKRRSKGWWVASSRASEIFVVPKIRCDMSNTIDLCCSQQRRKRQLPSPKSSFWRVWQRVIVLGRWDGLMPCVWLRRQWCRSDLMHETQYDAVDAHWCISWNWCIVMHQNLRGFFDAFAHGLWRKWFVFDAFLMHFWCICDQTVMHLCQFWCRINFDALTRNLHQKWCKTSINPSFLMDWCGIKHQFWCILASMHQSTFVDMESAVARRKLRWCAVRCKSLASHNERFHAKSQVVAIDVLT